MASLPAVLTELSAATLGAQFPALSALDDVAEVWMPGVFSHAMRCTCRFGLQDQTARADELSTMLDATRDSSRAIDASYAALRTNTQV